jgi:hypothetical protein
MWRKGTGSMKSSLAKQQEFDFDDVPEPPSTSDMTFPNFQVLNSRESVAVAARRAGRLNAANISDDEVSELLERRQRLLDKKFDGTMLRKDEIELTYVCWQLDRIDDARQGAQLDTLEALVTQYESLQRDLEDLHRRLSTYLPKQKKS